MKSLVKRAQRGDDQAFVELIEENKQAMYKVAMLELMEDGEYRKAAAAADLIDWKRVRIFDWSLIKSSVLHRQFSRQTHLRKPF